MKVSYETVIYGYDEGTLYRPFHKGDIKEIRQHGKLDYCCEEMRLNWGDVIDFGTNSTRDNTEVVVSIVWTSPGYGGEVEYASVPISFCPFCGGKFELIDSNIIYEYVKTETEKTTKEYRYNEIISQAKTSKAKTEEKYARD